MNRSGMSSNVSGEQVMAIPLETIIDGIDEIIHWVVTDPEECRDGALLWESGHCWRLSTEDVVDVRHIHDVREESDGDETPVEEVVAIVRSR